MSTIRYIQAFLFLFISHLAFAQSDFPGFLQGTWKMENKEAYEHWDRINSNTLKGFSYTVKNRQIAVSEYLEITGSKNEIIYTATVLNQNEGKDINFKLTKTDSTFTFENPHHDFPKKIVYQKLSDSEISVQVSDGMQKGFAYKMKKQIDAIHVDTTISNPNY
jgi:hypothetical protein